MNWFSTDMTPRANNALASHRRRARAAGVVLDYGVAELRELLEAAVFRPCPVCGFLMMPDALSVDHRFPTSRGGDHALANLEVVCRRCNEVKGALTAEEFACLEDALLTLPPAAHADVWRRLRAGGRVYGR